MPKVSVIMPVYNLERYLGKSLDSVVNQTFKDIEIICINDGSTDNSLAIIEDYARNDARIQVINQQNQGVSFSRNKGIDCASGDYIMFLDGDDTYDLTLCEKVVQKICTENPDIVMWGHDRRDAVTGNIVFPNMQVDNIKYLLHAKKPSLARLFDIQICIWDKAFKKEFLLKNKIKFLSGVTNAEDVIFCITSYLHNPKYSFIPKALYNYSVSREDSTIGKSKKNIIEKEFLAYKTFFNTELFQNLDKKMKLNISERFICGVIYYWKQLDKEEYRPQYVKDIYTYLDFIENEFQLFELIFLKAYCKLKIILLKISHPLFFIFFDIKTYSNKKEFILGGIKINIFRWTKFLREKYINEVVK